MPFLREWIANPQKVGAVAPSSPHLAELMTRDIDASTGSVLELGPGTGVFTEALLGRGVRQQDLTLVELGEGFSSWLATRYPLARVVCHDAARLHLAGIDAELRFGAVVSGLPLLSIPRATVFRILSGVVRRLRPGASMYQFTYGPRCPIHSAVLNKLELKAEKVGTVILNVPPASVYRIGVRDD